MYNILTAFSSQFSVLLLIIACSYAIGYLYFKLWIKKGSLIQNNNFFSSFAEKSIFGLSIIIASIAVVKTGGITVQSISILALVLFPFMLKMDTSIIDVLPSQKKNAKKETYNILFLVFISLFVFCFHFFSGFLPDHVYYAKLSSAIYKTGIETRTSMYNDYQASGGISLYHYAELWLNGFISHLFSLNSIFSFTHIVFPLFHFLSFITLFGFIYDKTLSSLKAFFVTFGLMYGSALLFFFILTPEEGHYVFWFYGLPDITSFKNIVIYPFLFSALYYFKKNSWCGFVLMLVLCCVNYITTVFAIIGGIIPIGIYYLFQLRKSEESRKKIIFIFILCIGIALLLFMRLLFKDSYQHETANRNIIHIINPLREYFIDFFDYLKRFLNYFLRPFYLYPIVSIGLIWILTNKTIRSKKVVVYIISCFIAGAAFTSLFFSLQNATQAISMIIPPFMVFISYMVYQYLPDKKSIWFIVVLVLFSLFNIAKVNVFYNGTLDLDTFASKEYNFAEKVLKNQKWAFYAEKYQNEWIYNGYVVGSTMLISDQTIFPIEITPYFDKRFKKYCIDNPDYPLRGVQPISDTNVTPVVNYLRDNDILYVYIRDSITANKSFLHCLKPVITEKEKGLWELTK
jgi:hypothetical protein